MLLRFLLQFFSSDFPFLFFSVLFRSFSRVKMGEGLMNVHSFSIYSTLEFCQGGKQFNAKTAEKSHLWRRAIPAKTPLSALPDSPWWINGRGASCLARTNAEEIRTAKSASYGQTDKFLQTQRLSHARVCESDGSDSRQKRQDFSDFFRPSG